MLTRQLLIALSISTSFFLSACSSKSEDDMASSLANAACPAGWQSAFNEHSNAGFSGTLVYVESGSVVCSFAAGEADQETNRLITTDTVFSIGSITKTFTAAAILKLVDEERLLLSDSAGSLLPSLSGPAASASIEQLLVHTSGLQGTHSEDFVPMDSIEAIAAISNLTSSFEHGTNYAYSNSGYTVLALIVNELTGSYREYIANEILMLPSGEQLGGFWSGAPKASGPRAFGYAADGTISEELGDFAGPHWAFDGNGGLAMTSEQLARWTQALANGDIISLEAVELMKTAVWDFGDGRGEALGWLVTAEPIYEQEVLDAIGFSSIIKHEMSVAWQPETGRILVVATNVNEGAFIADEDTIDVFNSGGPIAAPVLLTAEDLAFIESVSGTYTTGSERFVLAILDDEFVIAADGTETIAALFPPGELAEEFATHTALVTEFFNGETDAGQAEIDHLINNFGGPIATNHIGTFIQESGIATMLEMSIAAENAIGIYRLNEDGQLISAYLYDTPTPLDAMPMVPLKRDGDRWVPSVFDWPIDTIAVSFGEDGSMTITGPNGSLQAFPE